MTRPYVIRGGREGRTRLQLLSRVLHPWTAALLRQVGVGPGMHCLDMGCGGGDVALEMGRLVGPGGAVLGIDLDETKIELAAADALQQGLYHVHFRQADVLEFGEASAYDLVYARFLLTHLPEPARAARVMVQAAKPGGRVVVEDIDFAGHFCHPVCTAFQRYVELYQQAVRRRGGDPTIGPRVPGLLAEAGLQDLRVEVAQPVFVEGDGKLMAPITMACISDAVRAEKLATEAEVEAIVTELEAFARRPGTILSLPRIFQVWGRRS